MRRKLMQSKAIRDSTSIFENSRSFVSECSRVLNFTSTGTAIYILSCLYPADFNVILKLLRLDLSQPHHHPLPSKEHMHTMDFRSTADIISSLQKYARDLPSNEYSCLWLQVVERWLLTCPMDEEYYVFDEVGKDMFCHKLRSELLDRILNIS